MIRTVLIDLDDTLWDTRGNSKLSLEQLYKEYGWQQFEANYDHFFDVYITYNDDLWSRYRLGQLSKKELIVLRFSLPLSQFGIHYDTETILEISDKFMRYNQQQTGVVPGCRSLLQQIKQMRCKVVLITNGFAEAQEYKVQKSGIAPYLDFRVVSETIGIHKPHPEFFAYALSATHSRKEESIVIGDSLEADILGAQNFHLKSIWFNPYGKPFPAVYQKEKTYEVHHLMDIPPLLKKL